MAKPFLKWAGGKTALLPELLKAAPERIETYYEPFVGGGALFFALQSEGRFKQAVLSDSNRELINAYIQVRDNVEDVIDVLTIHQRKYRSARDPEAYYYKIRNKTLTCDLGGAANLIFLNKTCYNGLFRVNSNGRFNVPHGTYENPTICDEATLRKSSVALGETELVAADFSFTRSQAGPGDFVYADPPYLPISSSSNFTSYTSGGFGFGGQRRLARIAYVLNHQGAKVVVSNSSHHLLRKLYEGLGFRVEEVEVHRSINSDPDGRGPIPEFLIRNDRRPSGAVRTGLVRVASFETKEHSDP